MQDFKGKAKTIGRAAAFFLGMFLLLAVLSQWTETFSKGSEDRIQERNKSIVGISQEPEHTIDLVAVGDSLVFTSISPMDLWEDYGITSYICGQTGQKIQETYYILKSVFQTQSPQVVILESNVLFQPKSGVRGLGDAMAEWGNYHFPVFRFHDVWKSVILDGRYPQEEYKGFAIRENVQPYEGGEYMGTDMGKEQMTELVKTYMRRILSLCRQNKARLLVFSTPSPQNYNYRKHNTLEEYAKENSLQYLDLNLALGELGIDWNTDSLDGGDHLNLSGAKKLTAYLGTYLQENFKLLDHRGDDAYQQWEKEARQYQSKEKSAMDGTVKK